MFEDVWFPGWARLFKPKIRHRGSTPLASSPESFRGCRAAVPRRRDEGGPFHPATSGGELRLGKPMIGIGSAFFARAWQELFLSGE
jgi:hypothetical protein